MLEGDNIKVWNRDDVHLLLSLIVSTWPHKMAYTGEMVKDASSCGHK